MTLPEVLTVAPQGDDIFIGLSPDRTWKRIYGGLVVSQSLLAAYATIEGRVCHSLHSYFLRPGDPTRPVEYAVERTRDGASFAVRRVMASQGIQVRLHKTARTVERRVQDRDGARECADDDRANDPPGDDLAAHSHILSRAALRLAESRLQ